MLMEIRSNPLRGTPGTENRWFLQDILADNGWLKYLTPSVTCRSKAICLVETSPSTILSTPSEENLAFKRSKDENFRLEEWKKKSIFVFIQNWPSES